LRQKEHTEKEKRKGELHLFIEVKQFDGLNTYGNLL